MVRLFSPSRRLLEILMGIEWRFGCLRSTVEAPRSIDLDTTWKHPLTREHIDALCAHIPTDPHITVMPGRVWTMSFYTPVHPLNLQAFFCEPVKGEACFFLALNRLVMLSHNLAMPSGS